MKKLTCNFPLLSLILFLGICLSSCSSSNEEVCYSCNEKIDAWAREHQAVFQTYDREKIISHSGPEQRAIFRTLTPEKRKALWLDKIHTVIKATQNTEEKALLGIFKDFILAHPFDAHLSEDQFTYFEGLTKTGTERFGWTDEYIIVTFGTLEAVNDQHTYNFFTNPIQDDATVAAGLEELDCNCRWGWCPGGDCMEAECEETDFGCGFLGLGNCTKRCGGNPDLEDPDGQ